MTPKRLKIASLNANGMRNDKKRAGIFNFLRCHKVDVAAIQDTRFDPERDAFWKGSPEFRSWWTPKVAIIVFNKQVVVENECSPDDRILSLSLNISDVSLSQSK